MSEGSGLDTAGASQLDGTADRRRRPLGILVCNETNRRLIIQARDDASLKLALSPMERARRLTKAEEHRFELKQYEQQGYVSLAPEPDQTLVRHSTLLGVVRCWFLVFFPLAGLIGGLDRLYWLVGAGFLLVLEGLSLLLQWRKTLDSSLRSVASWVRQQVCLLLVLVIGVVLPSAMLLFSTGLWGHLKLAHQKGLLGDPVLHGELAGHLLPLLLIVTLSLLPALLFFAFDRQHVASLRHMFVSQIFRFDSTITTRRDIESKYGHLMDDAYGTDVGSNAERLLPTRRSPLFVSTLMITIGWTLTLLSMNPLDGDGSRSMAAVLAPPRSVLTSAFLGAYFYALQAVFRSYARRDLQPKSYSHIAIRIVAVTILAWVLSGVASSVEGANPPWLLALVFLIGIVPETGLVLIYDFVHKLLRGHKPWKNESASLVDEHEPLTELEGIDLYDRARLIDEGVTNVEALAHHDIIELTLMTRIPVSRLLDWLDQAILHLRMGKEERSAVLERLRQYGIRTATDLVKACEDEDRRARLECVLNATSTPPSANSQVSPRLDIILQTIKDEEWLQNLLQWHAPQKHKPLHLPEKVPRCPDVPRMRIASAFPCSEASSR